LDGAAETLGALVADGELDGDAAAGFAAGACVPAAGVSALAELPKMADMMSPKMLMTDAPRSIGVSRS